MGPMNASSLSWQTDARLEITALSRALRELAGILDTNQRLHLSDVWGHDGPLGLTMRSHHWVLEGTAVSLRARKGGRDYRLDLEPLVDGEGRVVGVNGWATELNA